MRGGAYNCYRVIPRVCMMVFTLILLGERTFPVILSGLIIWSNSRFYSMEIYPYELDKSFYSYLFNKKLQGPETDLVDFVLAQKRKSNMPF